MCYLKYKNTIDFEVYGATFPNQRISGTIKPYLKFTFLTAEDAQQGITINWNDGSDPETFKGRTETATDVWISKPEHYSASSGWHTYQDGINEWRIITITINAGLHTVTDIVMNYITTRGSLPTGITRCTNLNSLFLYAITGYSLEQIDVPNWDWRENGFDNLPPEFLNIQTLSSLTAHFSWKIGSDPSRSIPIELMNTALTQLNYGGGGDSQYFSDRNVNNFDKLPLLRKTLESFSSDHSGITNESIPDNWNDNSKLKTVHFHGFISLKKVETLLVDGVTTNAFIQSYGIGDGDNGNKWFDMVNNQQLNYLNLIGSLADSTVKIDNLDGAVKLKTIVMSGSTPQIALLGSEQEIINFFTWWLAETDRIASKDPTTVPYSDEGILRDMDIQIGGVHLDIILEAPNDFVAEVDNGTVDINGVNGLGRCFWILKNQYNQTVSYTAVS